MVDEPHKPIRTLSFRLTRADFLAYEMLPRELSGKMKLALMVIVGCGGIMIGLLPDTISTGAWYASAAVILMIAGAAAVAFTNWVPRRRASKHAVPQGEVVLEEWGDHLSQIADGRHRNIAMETIAQVLVFGERVFIRVGMEPVIVPLSAFEDENDMKAFAAAVDEASDAAQP
ncbi:hypothetical protein QBK99_05080 [Corticibacterium sp. UT-5YL-CI-8]|nr:hypothetical protein [Tianweitania sp. UT-5YL-CI-8]